MVFLLFDRINGFATIARLVRELVPYLVIELVRRLTNVQAKNR